MRILRKDYILHPFTEMPKDEDITDGYVEVVKNSTGEHHRFLYTVEYGWNTTSHGTDEYALTPEDMEGLAIGWISNADYYITTVEDSWMVNIAEMVEEIRMKLREEPDRFHTDEESEYWERIDELYKLMLTALDYAEDIAK